MDESKVHSPRALKVLGAAHKKAFLEHQGQQIVGVNSFGDLQFIWQPEEKAVIQRLWWRIDDDGVASVPIPMTTFKTSLEVNPLDFPPSIRM